MKIIDISNYCATNDIKPEIAGVYIEREGEIMRVTATDSYRLASIEYSLTEDRLFALFQRVDTGIYTRKAWKDIAECFSKKAPSFSECEQAVRVLLISKIQGQYPDYKSIIKTINCKNSGITKDYNCKYLIDFIDLINTTEKHKYATLKSSAIGETDNMLVYQKDKVTILLMQVLR